MAQPPVAMPAWPVAAARGKIPTSRWAAAVNAFTHQLEVNIATNDATLLSNNCLTFLKAYLNDEAAERLRQLDSDLPPASPAEFVLRKRTFEALRRIAAIPGAIDLGLLMDAAVVYEAGNHLAMVSLANTTLQATPGLHREMETQAGPALMSMLHRPTPTVPLLLRSSICIVRLLSCGDSVSSVFSTNNFLQAIAAAYSSVGAPSAAEEQHVLQVKINLMDTFHIVLEQRINKARESNSDREKLYELLFHLNDAAPASSNAHPATASSSSRAVLLQAPMLTAYESTYNLSQTLASVGPADDPTRDYMVENLKSLRIPGVGHAPQAPPQPVTNGTRTNGDVKGKSRATEPSGSEATELELKISQVLDILPDEDPSRIRACLQHAKFGGSVESVVAALLEGNLPPDLASHDLPEAKNNEAFPLLGSRRNVFDDEPLDFSKLRIGKNRTQNADSVLQDRTYMDAVKADILRRVQELSDEEDESGEPARGRIVAFEEELEDGMGPSNIRVTNDGEESGEGEEEEVGEAQQAKKVDVEALLEQTYLSDPKLFDRDAVTRRTKQRADLRAQTGWSDEQLEGWRIMLERNPRKEKILQKHEFAGNRPLISDDDEGQTSSAQASDREGQPGGRGRGSGGRGRGGGGGGGRGRGGGGGGEGRGGGNPARERAWKDKNKARQGNHDRKRGHDKKMARAGPPPA